MMDEADRERLRTLFALEKEELIAALNRGLVALEQQEHIAGRQEAVNELFRSAHTLKGAAQSVGANEIASWCHDLEDAFERMRQKPGAITAAALEPLYALVDAVAAGEAGPENSEAAEHGEPHRETTDQPAESPKAAAGTDRIRLPAGKLDALLRQAGEVLQSEQTLAALLREPGTFDPAPARRTGRRLRQAGAVLEDSIRTLRMAPFHEACAGLDRLARDMAARAGKSVSLEVVGGEVELDRPILEALREPLSHLVRNAVDHGIETPVQRREAGKPERGRIQVQAALQGGRVLVRVSDDGAGIDPETVRAAAMAAGADPAGATMSLLFSPGFSTAAMVTETSGRGVGLDAVRTAVEGLGGEAELEQTPGGGATVRLLLPLTLSAMRVVIVGCADQQFAFATDAIERLVLADAGQLRMVEGRERLLLDVGPVPLAPLSAVLGLAQGTPIGERFPVVLTATAGQTVALAVDELGGELEVTIRGLGERVTDMPAVLGGALLPDGRPVIVLSPTACARVALEGSAARIPRSSPAAPRRLRVLLAEDSLTTRLLEQAILEAAGYDVLAAADGMEAMDLLAHETVDIVVSDVLMPRMDGIQLCERLRSSPVHEHLPVVLVTSKESDEDRLRGLEAGANAYLTKQAFDQGNLLETIEQLVDTQWPIPSAS